MLSTAPIAARPLTPTASRPMTPTMLLPLAVPPPMAPLAVVPMSSALSPTLLDPAASVRSLRSEIIIPSVNRGLLVDPSPLTVVSPVDPRAKNNVKKVNPHDVICPPAAPQPTHGVEVQKPGLVSPWFDRSYPVYGYDGCHEWYCYIYPSDHQPPVTMTAVTTQPILTKPIIDYSRKLGQLRGLTVTVAEGMNLGVSPSGAFYIVGAIGQKQLPTSTRPNSPAVKWNERLEFTEVYGATEFRVQLLDGTSRVPLGTGLLKLDDLLLTTLRDGIIAERWIQVTRFDGTSGWVRLVLEGDFDWFGRLTKAHVDILDGRDLKGAENVYLVLSVGGQTQTTTAQPVAAPTWNQHFTFDIDGNPLRIRVQDATSQTAPGLGGAVLPFDPTLLKELEQGPVERWIDILMTDGSKAAVRVALHGEFEGDEERLRHEEALRARAAAMRRLGQLRDLHVTIVESQGLPLPAVTGPNVYLALNCGGQTKSTPSRTIEAGQDRVTWNECLSFEANGANGVHIELLDAASRAAFAIGDVELDRGVLEQMQTGSPAERWVQLTAPDGRIGWVKLSMEGEFERIGNLTRLLATVGGSRGTDALANSVYLALSVGNDIKTTTAQPTKGPGAENGARWDEILTFDVTDATELFIRLQDEHNQLTSLAYGSVPFDDALLSALTDGTPAERWVPLNVISPDHAGTAVEIQLSLVGEFQGSDDKRKAAEEEARMAAEAEAMRQAARQALHDLRNLRITVRRGKGLLPPIGVASGPNRSCQLGLDAGSSSGVRTASGFLREVDDESKEGSYSFDNTEYPVPVPGGVPFVDLKVDVFESSEGADPNAVQGTGMLRISEDVALALLRQGPNSVVVPILRQTDGGQGSIELTLVGDFASDAEYEARILAEQERLRQLQQQQQQEKPRSVPRPSSPKRVSRKHAPEEGNRRPVAPVRRPGAGAAAAAQARPAVDRKSAPKRAFATAHTGEAVRIVQRAWIGVEIKVLDDALGNKDCVVVVHSVLPNSPASKSGLKPEDIVIRFGDKFVKSKEGWDNAVKKSSIGSKVDLQILRNGSPVQCQVTIGSTQKILGGKRTVKTATRVGLTRRRITGVGMGRPLEQQAPKPKPKPKGPQTTIRTTTKPAPKAKAATPAAVAKPAAARRAGPKTSPKAGSKVSPSAKRGVSPRGEAKVSRPSGRVQP